MTSLIIIFTQYKAETTASGMVWYGQFLMDKKQLPCKDAHEILMENQMTFAKMEFHHMISNQLHNYQGSGEGEDGYMQNESGVRV